ncbi:MAG TPA: SsrA-binding protein SmpB [Thermomicrobiales bacterium]|nr:SsrA-binding protein SmpB [Thermomicrobiales bacterium]HRA46740.1 SsrA-binding protein SmpB [Thermomicrobiales bacterium]
MAKTAVQQKEQRRADRVVTSNRRANFDYFIEETIEAGIVLHGTEIKSLREGKASIGEAYARIRDGELWLLGASISPYEFGSYTNHEPDRPRKLLVHKKQIRLLRAEIEQKGKTIVPLRIRLKDGKAKVDIGVAKGKKNYDKRQTESDRDAKREIDRAMRSRS